MTTQLLLECGAEIGEINSIRKHLSRSKGGGLARAAYPATLISLILSDVVGDRLDVIASGPTVPDASRFADCLAMVKRYGLASRLPGPVWQYLKDGAAGLWPETPEAGDPIFDQFYASQFPSLSSFPKQQFGASSRPPSPLGSPCPTSRPASTWDSNR